MPHRIDVGARFALVLSCCVVGPACDGQPPSASTSGQPLGPASATESVQASATVSAPTDGPLPNPWSLLPDARSATPLEPAAGSAEAMSLPLFACGSSNAAWGDYSSGFVVDDAGRIWSYNITQFEQGASRFQNLVLQTLRVGRDDLDSKRGMLKQASAGRIVERQVAFDMGVNGCWGYVTAPGEPEIRVELGTQGDSAVWNTAPEAALLLRWLRVDLGMGAPPPQRPAPPRKPKTQASGTR